ncbi:MAG TPA: CAP domain-containing protein [Desulfobulbaceae bacterium]|nr:CAP domain-containing protein [Desulfobulbaceae bacterium]
MSTKIILVVACLLTTLIAPAAAREEILPEHVLDEINLARTEPQKYVEFLIELRKQFQDNSYLIPGTDVVVETTEGVAAVDEAVAFLADRKPIPPLVWSAGLAASAAELVREQSKSGVTGHDGKRSGGLSARTKRHGIRQKSIGENIAYGPNSPRAIVIDLIIDDGVPNRGHRKNLFNPTFTKAGISCGFHPLYETICVIDFSR